MMSEERGVRRPLIWNPRRTGRQQVNVYFDDRFYQVYASDPAAAAGRMEAIVEAISGDVTLVPPRPADTTEISAAHSAAQIDRVSRDGCGDIAALAAGAAVQAAETGLSEPSFALIRPPGHHASTDSSWGFCYYNNMAIALLSLKRRALIDTAFILDFDLHFGDGTVNILGACDWVTILNPERADRQRYLEEVETALGTQPADIIGVSAGFDNHVQDWGGLLTTEDYRRMGRWVRRAARDHNGGCFGVLEGGYNHAVLGGNVSAFLEGLRRPGDSSS